MTAFRPRRRTVLSSLAALAAASCAPPARELADRQPPIEGGIGGTGIVGTVTGLSSIRVNGLTVAVDADTVVVDSFGPRPAASLAPGHSVTVEAVGPADALVARRVAVVHPLAGRIGWAAADGRRFRLLGVEVTLEGEAPGHDLVATGRPVAVSGLWRGDTVVASRLDPLDAAAPAVIAGTVHGGADPGERRLAGLPLVLPAGADAPALGSFAAALGGPADGRFVARTLRPDRFVAAAGPLVHLSVEGYLEPIAQAPGFTVSGLGHSFDEAAELASLAGDRALFLGGYDGDFVVRHGLPLPDGAAARAALLAGLGDPFAPGGAVGTR